MDTNTRLADILQWWSAVSDVFASFAKPEELTRVQNAFERVLQAIPENHLQTFINFAPRFLCCPRADAATWRFRTRQGELRIIYLAPDFGDFAQEWLEYALAHEVAHVVLDHDPATYKSRRVESERDADVLLEEWGFTEPKKQWRD